LKSRTEKSIKILQSELLWQKWMYGVVYLYGLRGVTGRWC
jgi:hypothetical protein